jgi:hypothetical protein
VVSRAAKLLGRRLHRNRSLSSCRPSEKMGWIVLGLRPAVEYAAGRVTQKRYWCTARTRNVLRANSGRGPSRPTEPRASCAAYGPRKAPRSASACAWCRQPMHR